MRIAPENGTGELLTRMRYHDDLIGNTFLPAIHGGTLGAMLEMAAIFHLLWETETETVPKIVNITVDYLRSARPVDVIAAAKVTKQGRRMVNVFAEAWQDDRSKPVATASAHFLVTSVGRRPAVALVRRHARHVRQIDAIAFGHSRLARISRDSTGAPRAAAVHHVEIGVPAHGIHLLEVLEHRQVNQSEQRAVGLRAEFQGEVRFGVRRRRSRRCRTRSRNRQACAVAAIA